MVFAFKILGSNSICSALWVVRKSESVLRLKIILYSSVERISCKPALLKSHIRIFRFLSGWSPATPNSKFGYENDHVTGYEVVLRSGFLHCFQRCSKAMLVERKGKGKCQNNWDDFRNSFRYTCGIIRKDNVSCIVTSSFNKLLIYTINYMLSCQN